MKERKKRVLTGLLLLEMSLLLFYVPGSGHASGEWTGFDDVNSMSSAEDFIVNEFTGSVTITFLGDCTLGGEKGKSGSSLSFAKRIEQEGFSFPFRGLLPLTENDDLTIANLEVVLSDRDLKKEKKEYNFIGKTSYTEILKLGSIDCVTIANNHTHDYGDAGYADTKDALDHAGIPWFSMETPAVWQNDSGLKIGFLGVNYSLTGNRSKRFREQADAMRESGCAAIIVYMHAGDEYDTSPPTGYQKQIVDRAAEAGCCLVIGSHPHIVQGWDMKEGIPVVYSLGNCSFGGTTFAKDSDALAVQAVLSFELGSLTEIRLIFIPISITSDTRHNNYSPRILEGNDAERVLQKMEKTTGRPPGERNPDGTASVIIKTDTK